MKSTLAAGLAATAQIEVDRERTIDFMGEQARVYATPMLVRDIEIACRNLLLDHLAATLMGMRATLKVTVATVDGRAVTFDFEGHDSVEPICRGRHARFVVDVGKTRQRLAAKAKKAS